jgi:hypothetical protein
MEYCGDKREARVNHHSESLRRSESTTGAYLEFAERGEDASAESLNLAVLPAQAKLHGEPVALHDVSDDISE